MGSASKTGYGNNWVVAAIVVRLPAVSKPVAIPVLAKLVIKDTISVSALHMGSRTSWPGSEDSPMTDHIENEAVSKHVGGALNQRRATTGTDYIPNKE